MNGPINIDQTNAERSARDLAFYTRPATVDGKTASDGQQIIVGFWLPSKGRIGHGHLVTAHRPRGIDWTSDPDPKDWHIWECDCEWASHHSAGMGHNACVHLRAARIYARIQQLLRQGIGIDWWERIRSYYPSCIGDPLLVPPQIVAATRPLIDELIQKLDRGEIPETDPWHLAARHAKAALRVAAPIKPPAERRTAVHTAAKEEI